MQMPQAALSGRVVGRSGADETELWAGRLGEAPFGDAPSEASEASAVDSIGDAVGLIVDIDDEFARGVVEMMREDRADEVAHGEGERERGGGPPDRRVPRQVGHDQQLLHLPSAIEGTRSVLLRRQILSITQIHANLLGDNGNSCRPFFTGQD